MTLVDVNPNMPQEQMVAAIAQNFREVDKKQSIVQQYKDETGTPRILLGRLPDGTYGLVISEEGVDVTTLF